MATTYKGVIAGIGNKQDNVNVITPNFDAYIRKFIIGQDGIIEGFDYSRGIGGFVLTGGACIAQGYLGFYSEKIEKISDNSLIYFEFIVNHNETISDEFNIIVSDTLIDEVKDDILHTAGRYVIPVNFHSNSYLINITTSTTATGRYFYGQKTITSKIEHDFPFLVTSRSPHFVSAEQIASQQFVITVRGDKGGQNLPTNIVECYRRSNLNRISYPLQSLYSDYTTVVKKGELPADETNLEDGVTATTQDVNDNSDKVATTEYVHNLIIKEIGDEELNIQSQWGNKAEDYIFLKLHYRAKFVLGPITVNFGQGTTLPIGTTIYTLPQKFCPQSDLILTGSRGAGSVLGIVKTDGSVSFTSTNTAYDRQGRISYKTGYETN